MRFQYYTPNCNHNVLASLKLIIQFTNNSKRTKTSKPGSEIDLSPGCPSRFDAFGEITSACVMSDPVGRKFGFVNFKEEASATKAIEELHNKDMRPEERHAEPVTPPYACIDGPAVTYPLNVKIRQPLRLGSDQCARTTLLMVVSARVRLTQGGRVARVSARYALSAYSTSTVQHN